MESVTEQGTQIEGSVPSLSTTAARTLAARSGFRHPATLPAISREERLRRYFGVLATGRGRGWCLSWRKRSLDLAVASLVCTLCLPLFAIVALAIKIDSPGPVLFRQWRTGFLGKRFRIFKFRTMYTNAERIKESLRPLSRHGADSPDFKIDGDPRVTRVGNLLRRASLDELPNLFNVVLGDMSLVGPRPTSFDVDSYVDWHTVRLSVPPGITGLWQVSGRSEVDFDKRVGLDCEYIENQSLGLDLRILLRTPLRVLDGRGAC